MNRNGNGYGYSCLEYDWYQQILYGDEFTFRENMGYYGPIEQNFTGWRSRYRLLSHNRKNSNGFTIYYHDASEYR